jgi:hypothetical protein
MAIFSVIDTTDGGDTEYEGFVKDAANWAIAETALSGATTEILVGGGEGSAPVFTTATGSGAPVRATSPTLVTPVLGAASATSVTASGNIISAHVTASGTVTGTTAVAADTISEITGAHGVTVDGVTLKDGGATVVTGGTNTFNITNGTASLDVAAGATLNVDASCTFTNGLTVSGGNSGTISFGAASKTLTITGDATIASTPVSPVGKQTIWIPAVAMTPRTSNGAAVGIAETSTYKNMLHTLDFATGADEFAQFCIQMPKSWDEGTLTAVFVWSHSTTTTNFGVSWWIQAVALANGEALDVSYGTSVEAQDTGGDTDYVYISPATSAMTVSGSPAANEYVMFQVFRDVSDAGDTLGIDARLHGIQLYYTTDAGTDD